MLLTGILVYQGLFRPEPLNSATNTYYFGLSSVNLGADGSTNTAAVLNGKISMSTGVYTTSQRVSASSVTTEQTLINAYGPAYATKQTVDAPAVTIGVRDRNGTANNIYWKAYVYDYDPAGTAGNGTLLWTSDAIESHPAVQTPLALTFTNPLPKDVNAGHRLKVVITCQMASTASSARLQWGSGTNYAFFTVTEANYVANSVTVTNLADYYGGQLTSVTQGDKNVPMLQFDLYTNVAGGTTWTGGKLDQIGTNNVVNTYVGGVLDTPSDVSFSIYKDSNGTGAFEPTDTLVGGPYTYDQLIGQTYTLATAQNLTSTPQRYFIVYNFSRTATYNTTAGARIVDGSYFTVGASATGGVVNVASTSSSTPNINYGGVAITKVYAADWDSGTSLTGIAETGGPSATNTSCITRTTAAASFPLVGLLNYPAHNCSSIAGQGYSTSSAQSNFATLYFGGVGYASNMLSVQGTSFTCRVSTNSGGTVTLQLFYVTAGGVRVNAPITSTFTTNSSINQATTISLAGQSFSNVPQGARLGIQIGVTANMTIGLGGANGLTGTTSGANLTVDETAAANENVDVGNGVIVSNANVYASDTGFVLDSFNLTAAKAKTVTGITLTGNALFNSTNIKNVKLYQDAGTLGALDAADTLVATLPGSSISGNSISFTGLSLSVSTSVKRYLVVVDISDTPNVNVIVQALVSGLTVATTGTMGDNTDSTGATLTIQPTTTLTNGTAEPANTIVNANAGATLLDAFGIKTNGGINDQITDVTVTLSTASALPVGNVVSDFVSKVEIVDSTNTVVYGYLTAPTTGDNWQVVTAGLYATVGTSQCYVRITPKANLGGTYVVKASVTSLTHLRSINRLVLGGDTTSGAVTLDGAPPTDPPNFTATTASNAAAINLDWNASTDASGSAVTYAVVRGLGNAPAPKNCTPVAGKVFQIYQGSYPGTTPKVVDSGLVEGESYGYRVCATDAVGNTSAGSTSHTTAGIINRCNLAPTLQINPSDSYINAGETKQLAVTVTNNDTGVCSASTFQLSLVGTPNTTDYAPVTFTTNNFVLPTNGGAMYLKMNVTANAGAPQLAMNHFSVKVDKSGASVATVQYPDPVHVVVNKYGTMMHSSMQLGTQKYGQWGLNYTCATCHNPNATNLKRVNNVIATPTGNRSVVFTTISAARTVTTGVMGNDLRGGTTSTNVCEVCHHNARFHQYSSSKVAWNTHNNSQDCMRCHDHRIGFKTVNQGLSCTDCHGYPPSQKSELVNPPTNVLYPYTVGNDAGAHPTHNARNVKCQACHSNANHLTTAQPDTHLNMGFSIRSSNFTGFNGFAVFTSGIIKSVTPSNGYTFVAAPGTTIAPAYDKIMTCSVYCHGYWNGSYTASGGYNTEVSWSGVSQTGCSSCHGGEAASPPPSGSHQKHAGNKPGYGNGINCGTCHGYRNYSTSKTHLNGKVEWDLSSISTIAAYKGLNKGNTGAPAPSAPASYGSCSNLYCHSNVQSAGGTGGPTSYATPTWGGSTTCGSCHPEPNTSGGHSQHVAPGVTGFSCRICHGSGGDANPLNHANGKINFLFGGLASNTHYSYSSAKTPGSGPYGTCYNSDCHGRRTITWGPSTAISLCNKCHTTNPSSSGFYSTAGPGGTTSNTDPYVGAHFQHITSMPFKFSAKFDCSQCHLKPTGPYSPGHIDTALPAELTFGTLATSGVQNGYTSAAHQPSYSYATKQCSNVWCHGAGMNSNQGTGPYGSIGPVAQGYDGGTLGSPLPAIWNSPFLATAPDKCQTCHASPPPAPKSGYQHFDDDTGAPYARTKCTNCHRHLNATGDGFSDPTKHANGVVDSCNNCHGRPPIDNGTLTKPAIGALSTGAVGAHQAHRLNPNIGNDCTACHYNSSYAMPSYQLEIGFHAYGNRVTRGVFYGMSSLPSIGYSQPIVYFSTWTSTKVRRTSDTTKINTCSNVYCHGGGTNTLPALGGGTNTSPNWEKGPSQATCGSCHGVTGNTYNTRGSHGAHVGTAFGDPHLDCSNCHGIKVNNYHVNGKVEWNFYTTAQRLNQLAISKGFTNHTTGSTAQGYKNPGAANFTTTGYANNLAPSPSYGSCQVYCHSDVYDKYYRVPTWGSAPMTCDSCHRDQTTAGRFTGSHQKHAASSVNGGYSIDCMICHNGSGAGNPLHINGVVDVIFNTSIVGTAGVYNSATKQCFNILCHDSTASTGPTWGTSSTGNYNTGTYKPTCIGCHSGQVGGRTAVIPQFAGASHHVQGVPMSATYCYPCHMEANANGTVNPAFHNRSSNRTVDLVIWKNGARGATPVFTRYTAAGSASRKRTEYAKINNVCIGCHRGNAATATPFSASGDTRTPEAYSWDTYSIYERYSTATTTAWGKVTGNSTVNKTLTKAYSAHGRADLNQRGWTFGSYTGGPKHVNAGSSVKVLCIDCHNSHGTLATGVMTSYSSATGRYSGGMLKSTIQGVDGYNATYAPVAGGDPAAPNKNVYNTGASLCFDCHNNKTSSATMPWGYNSTFGSSQPIYGYNDKPYFGNYSTFASTITYPYKANNPTNKGGHYGPSSPLTTTVTQRTFPSGMKDRAYSAGVSSPINGLCTPCHDPHGVSPSLGANQQYGVPLLKGTWVTSPYKMDATPQNTNEVRGGSSHQPTPALNVGSTPLYRIDQNSMQAGTSGTPATAKSWTFATAATTLQTTTDTQFAGLCTGCHNKSVLNNTAAVQKAPGTTGSWRSMTRIHNTVNGWAVTTGTGGNMGNKVHAFTCSKCHTPHNARLPRLMVTNCLDAKHRGRVVTGGNPQEYTTYYQSGAGKGRFPIGGGGYKSRGSASNPGSWFFGQSQTTVQNSAPALTVTTQTQCHNTATAGGATYTNYTTQRWNNKTPW
ncbi:CxxxxCH/CxxCH domain c-type cytochrome [Geobacter pickeringii]|nr:CxxxxCH/CxxCH domain-containing protein [Geobacter pickeringii]